MDVLKRSDAAISTDGKDCWLDNVFLERLWRSVKQNEFLPARVRDSSGTTSSARTPLRPPQ